METIFSLGDIAFWRSLLSQSILMLYVLIFINKNVSAELKTYY